MSNTHTRTSPPLNRPFTPMQFTFPWIFTVPNRIQVRREPRHWHQAELGSKLEKKQPIQYRLTWQKLQTRKTTSISKAKMICKHASRVKTASWTRPICYCWTNKSGKKLYKISNKCTHKFLVLPDKVSINSTEVHLIKTDIGATLDSYQANRTQ